MPFKHSERAFAGGLEALLIVLILAAASLICLQSFSIMIRASTSLESHKQLSALQAQLVSHLDLLMQDIDNHPITLLPTIHRSGKIHFSDGSLLDQVSDHFRPASNSDAISYLRLRADSLSRIRILEQKTSEFTVELCPLLEPGSDISLNTLILIGPDGLMELNSRERLVLRKHCKTMNFVRDQKSIIPELNQELNPRFMYLALAVEQIYTLYRSQTGQLRMLSHRGTEVIENQPILSGIHKLQLHGSLSSENQIYSLLLKASFDKLNFEMSFSHHIARTPLYDILFRATSP